MHVQVRLCPCEGFRHTANSVRTRRRGRRLLALAHVWIALFAVGVVPAGAAPDRCAESASGNQLTVTCTGNQSQGVSETDFTAPPAGTPETRLRVRDLSGAIAPPAGTDGVAIGQLGAPYSGALRAEVDTGSDAIVVRGANTTGIRIATADGDADARLVGNVGVRGQSDTRGLDASVASGAGDATLTAASGTRVRVTADAASATGLTARAIVGDATVANAGDIVVSAAQGAVGASAASLSGVASISVTGGTIEVTGDRATGTSAQTAGTGTRPGTATVTVEAGARIVARGALSRGIEARGGDLGLLMAGIAARGTAEVAVAGVVEVEGADAIAIDLNATGVTALTISGRVAATGDDAVALRATSGERIDLRLETGADVAAPIAAHFIGGSSDPNAPNRLTIAAGAALRGAIQSGDDSAWIENRGRLDLRDASDFGAGRDHIENRGRLSPGGRDRIARVSVAGLETLRQGDTGVLEVDLDATAGNSDQIRFAGPTELSLEGRVEVQEQGMDFRRGTQSYTLLTTEGSLQTVGLDVADTTVVDYELVAAGGALRLDRTVLGFCPAGLGGESVGEICSHIERIAEALGPGDPLGPGLLAPLGETREMGDYRETLARLSPRPYEALLQSTWYAEQAFAEAMWRGCAEAAGALGPKRYCLWGGLAGRQLERRARGPGGDFSSWSVGPQGGIRLGLGHLGPLSVSASSGFGYEAAELELARSGNAEGDRLLGGLALHGRLPLGLAPRGHGLALELDFAADGGFSWYEASRRVAFAAVASARAEPEIGFAGLHGRVAMRWGSGAAEPGLYGRLGLEGNAVYITADDLDETRAGLLAWRFDEVHEVVGTLRPGAEIGGLLQRGSFSLRPHVRIAGAILVGDADPRLRVRLASAPRAAGQATVRGDMDRRLIEVGGGLALSHGEHLALQLGYRGRFAADGDGDTRAHEGSLHVQVRF